MLLLYTATGENFHSCGTNPSRGPIILLSLRKLQTSKKVYDLIHEFEILKYLRENMSEKNPIIAYGRTLLHCAAWTGKLEICKYLIEDTSQINLHHTKLSELGEKYT